MTSKIIMLRNNYILNLLAQLI